MINNLDIEEQLKNCVKNHNESSSIPPICYANDKILEIERKLKNGLPSIPTFLKDELKCNIFLKAKDVESFSKLRDLKDNF